MRKNSAIAMYLRQRQKSLSVIPALQLESDSDIKNDEENKFSVSVFSLKFNDLESERLYYIDREITSVPIVLITWVILASLIMLTDYRNKNDIPKDKITSFVLITRILIVSIVTTRLFCSFYTYKYKTLSKFRYLSYFAFAIMVPLISSFISIESNYYNNHLFMINVICLFVCTYIIYDYPVYIEIIYLISIFINIKNSKQSSELIHVDQQVFALCIIIGSHLIAYQNRMLFSKSIQDNQRLKKNSKIQEELAKTELVQKKGMAVIYHVVKNNLLGASRLTEKGKAENPCKLSDSDISRIGRLLDDSIICLSNINQLYNLYKGIEVKKEYLEGNKYFGSFEDRGNIDILNNNTKENTKCRFSLPKHILNIVISDTIANAISHGKENNIPQLTWHIDVEKERLFVYIINQVPEGVWLTEERIAELMNMGTSISTDSRSMNTGWGLAISKNIIDLMHGEFKMEFDSGSVYTKIELPIENISYADADEEEEKEMEEENCLPSNFRIFTLDDHCLINTLNKVSLPEILDISVENVHVFGNNVEECESFVDMVIGLPLNNNPTPNLIILDQNLDYIKKSYLGSEIAIQLRERGYTGCICLCTASAPGIIDTELPGVDFILDKYYPRCRGNRGSIMGLMIKSHYLEWYNNKKNRHII